MPGLLQAGHCDIIAGMTTSETPLVLLLAADRANADRWAEMLRQGSWRLVASRADLPERRAPHVVIADLQAEALRQKLIALADNNGGAEESGPAEPGPGIARDRWDGDNAGGPEWANDNVPARPVEQAPPPLGLIAIGADDDTTPLALPADVRLPVDFVPRELRTAVALLIEVVRLRRQLTRHDRLRRRLSREAATDPLTSVANRRAWDRQLGLHLAVERADGPAVCIALFDVDQLKPVNDRHGHAAGDRVLVETAASLRSALRQSDFVARLGGDEFGVLLEVPDRSTAATVIERVRRTVCRRLSGLGLGRVTATAGYCLPSADDRGSLEPVTATAAADAALREAKHRGRDCAVEAAM